jgi:hypothetical protein
MRVARVVGSAVLATGLGVIVSCAQVIGAGAYHVGQTSGEGGSTCTSSSVDPNALIPAISACVLYWGCFPFQPVAQTPRLSDCITLDVPAAVASQSCARTAQSCSDIESCLGYGYATPQDCPNQGAFCNGTNRAATCSGTGSGHVWRCDVLKGTCKTYTSGGSTVAGCEVVPSCSDSDQSSHCNQNAVYTCVGGVGYGQQCGANATCKTVDTSTGCYSKQPSCSLQSDHCQGDHLLSCTKGGDAFDFDCSSVGLTCQETANDAGTSSPSCLAAGCTADDQANCTESCDGTTANLCIGGAPIGVACTDFGMTSCKTYQVTDSNNVTKQYAYCRPY